MKKTPFQKRLRAIIQDLQMSDKEFAKFVGISHITLSGYLNSRRTPTVSVVATWLAKTSINGHWLLTGEGHMFQQQNLSQSSSPNSNSSPAPVQSIIGSLKDAHLPNETLCAAAKKTIELHSPTNNLGGIEVVSPNMKASGQYFTNRKMLVRAGSVISKTQSSISDAAKEMRKIMDSAGWLLDLENEEEELILLKDSLSLSPSAAAGFVSGSSRNGKTFWRHKTTLLPLKQISKTHLTDS